MPTQQEKDSLEREKKPIMIEWNNKSKGYKHKAKRAQEPYKNAQKNLRIMFPLQARLLFPIN